MKRVAVFMMLITILSKLIGFSRDMVLSYYYGASNISDAYIISTAIPTLIFGFIGAALSVGYIPIYSEIEHNLGRKDADSFTSNLVNILLILTTIIFLFCFCFAPLIVRLFAIGFSKETIALCVQFTKISLIGMYITGLLYICNSYLQIKGNFLLPALAGFPLNIIVIIFIFISDKEHNLYFLPIGTVIGLAGQVALMVPFLFSNGYKYKFKFNLKDKYIKAITKNGLPAILGISVNQINTLIDASIASLVVIGAISALNYANRVVGAIEGVFALTVSTLVYPSMSKFSSENNISEVKKIFTSATITINVLIIPISALLIFFSREIVLLLYGRGAFGTTAISMTANALEFYSFGLLGSSLRELLSRTFYSLQDTKTPSINASISLIMNIILIFILSRYWGIIGLASAPSISATLCTILLFISLRKKIGINFYEDIFFPLIKIIFAAFLMVLGIKLTNQFFVKFGVETSLLISILIGLIIYLVVIYIMRIAQIDDMIKEIKKRILNKVLTNNKT